MNNTVIYATRCNNKAPFTLRTTPNVDACTAPYIHVRQCTATYGTVRRRRTLQMLNCMLYLPLLSMGTIALTSVAVRRRSVCERCRRNQRTAP